MVKPITWKTDESRTYINAINSKKQFGEKTIGNVESTIEELYLDEDELSEEMEFDDKYYGFSEMDYVDDIDLDEMGLTDEDIELLKGTMTQEEYDSFKEGIKNYYDELGSYLESLINGYEATENMEGFTGIQGLIDRIDYYLINLNNVEVELSSFNNQLSLRIDYYLENGDLLNLFEGTGITREDFALMDIYSKMDFLKKNDQETQKIINNRKNYLEEYDAKVKEDFSDLGIETYEDLKLYKEDLINKKKKIKQAINMAKNLHDSAEYDYLCFLKEYEDYDNTNNLDPIEIEKYKTKYYGRDAWDDGYSQSKLEFSYTNFVKDHPDITPLEFIQMIEARYPGAHYICYGIKNVEDLKELYKASTAYPEMLKKYNYLYDKNPEEATQYLEDTKYEINNTIGQINAKKFLEGLNESTDIDALDEAFYNEFNIHLKGLTDGLDTFGEGVGYSIEALLTYFGFSEDNRVMSASDYEKMYILYALLSEKEKIKLKLLDKNGNNADPNSIIDFTKEYSGPFLSNNYELSQGIGNMLPVILISTMNPTAGAWSMGISVSGNSYHEAMVKGNDFFSSLIYGVLSGTSETLTERFLGGLPGISIGNKSFIMSMLSEANEESLQGIIDAIFKKALLHEDLPGTKEEWDEFILDIGKQGSYGALTAGYINTFGAVAGRISIHQVNQFLKNNEVTREELNSVLTEIRNNDENLNNLSDNQIINLYREKIINQIKINRLVNNYQIDYKIATVMVENNVGEKVATYMIDNNVSPEEITKALESLRNSKRKYANKNSEYISSKYATDLINQININRLIESGIDSEIATIMVAKNVNELTANYMKENNVGPNTATYMMANNINISGDINLEKLVSTMSSQDGNIKIPRDILQEFGIQLNKGESIRYNKNTNVFERLDKNGNVMYTIPNNAINDPSQRVIKVGDRYIDQVTQRQYKVAVFEKTQDGYEHTMNGVKVYDKKTHTPKGVQGGHNYNAMKDNPDYVVIVDEVDQETGLIFGTWTFSSGDIPNKPDHTWFPQSWDEVRITDAVNKVLNTNPVAIHINKDGKAMYYGVVDNVPILVLTQDGEVETAFPVTQDNYDEYMSQNQWIDIR